MGLVTADPPSEPLVPEDPVEDPVEESADELLETELVEERRWRHDRDRRSVDVEQIGVAGDDSLRACGRRKGDEVVVARVAADLLNVGRVGRLMRRTAQRRDELDGLIVREIATECRPSQHVLELGEQAWADDDLVPALQPEPHDTARHSGGVDQRGDEDVEVEYRPHAVEPGSASVRPATRASCPNLLEGEVQRRGIVETFGRPGPTVGDVIEHDEASQPEPAPERLVDKLVLGNAIASSSAPERVEDVLVNAHGQRLSHGSRVRPRRSARLAFRGYSPYRPSPGRT